MAFQSGDKQEELMGEINMTPLVDVMLVLLIIFMITVPLMKSAVNVDLPRATSLGKPSKNNTIRLSIDAQGKYFWNNEFVDDEKLSQMLETEAKSVDQKNIQLYADKDVRYERVAKLVSSVQRVGIKHVALITQSQSN